MVTKTLKKKEIEPRIMAGILKVAKTLNDPEWADWAIIKTEKNIKTMPELKPLQDKLLSLGGDWVALEPECVLDALLNKGQLIKGRILFKRMASHNCHGNCAQLWEKNSKIYKIATGWALSADGIWRQHTWLLKGKLIIETTEPRTLYYGIVLGDEEANNFWWQNR